VYVGTIRERRTKRGVVQLFKYRENGRWHIVACLPTCPPTPLRMLLDEIRFAINANEEAN
jgi:hypothetical protein